MMKYGLTEITIGKINSVFEKYPNIEKAVLYGSRAKGNYKNGSDIDITLKGEGLNLTVLLKIENDIDELNLPYKIDLSVYSEISNIELIEHINRVGVLFFIRPGLQFEN